MEPSEGEAKPSWDTSKQHVPGATDKDEGGDGLGSKELAAMVRAAARSAGGRLESGARCWQ